MSYPGDHEYCDAQWPYDRPYDALAEYNAGKQEARQIAQQADNQPAEQRQ